MIKNLLRYNPAKDTELAQLPQGPDDGGCAPDIDSTLYHSEEHGFYLHRQIVQIRRDGVWETAVGTEECLATSRAHRRCLRTIRPLTRAQTIRMILESYLPEEEGAKDAVLEALIRAGIIDQA
jgi:hypothetical protein